jgi:transposase
MGYARPIGGTVPDSTARVARRIFRKGHPYLQLRDQLGPIFQDASLRNLFDHRGQPGLSPGLLALVTALQYAEGLSDRQAADAVRSRIDWKYCLGLELDDEGFDYSVLSEFRSRLVQQRAQLQLLELLLGRLEEVQLLNGSHSQRTDSTHVLSAVRNLNRLELVGETLRHALEVLAVAYPDWLVAFLPLDWFDRYGERFEDYRLPRQETERQALALTIGQDGQALLVALAQGLPEALALPALQVLQVVWEQQYSPRQGQLVWRSPDELPAAQEGRQSPFDLDARWSVKRRTKWSGYKVHLTECCGQEGPRLITDVRATPATTPDGTQTQLVQEALVQRGLTPQRQLADRAYPDAQTLVHSAELGIDLVSPVAADTNWQARQKSGYDLSRFQIDWASQQVTCPQGQKSVQWNPSHDSYDNEVIHVKFAAAACRSCPARAQCTRGQGARSLKLRPQAQHEAMVQARLRQTSPDFWAAYRPRAGVEATMSQGVRSFELRRSRYRGLDKTQLHCVLVAVAINLTRAAAWLAGDRPAGTRRTHLQALRPVASP